MLQTFVACMVSAFVRGMVLPIVLGFMVDITGGFVALLVLAAAVKAVTLVSAGPRAHRSGVPDDHLKGAALGARRGRN